VAGLTVIEMIVWLTVTLTSGALTVAVAPEGFLRPIRVAVGDDVRELRAGDQHTFALTGAGEE